MKTLYSISTFKASRKFTCPLDDGDPPSTEDIQAKIDAAVEAAVEPLKKNRDDILAEKKTTAEALKKANSVLDSLGGEAGIKTLLDLKGRGESDETLQRIQNGEWQEVFQEKNQELIKNYEGQLNEQKDAVVKAQEAEKSAVNKYMNKMREVETLSVTAASESFQKAANPDVLVRAAAVFNHFNEDTGLHEIRDKDGVVKIGKDGVSPYSMGEWLEAQKEVCSHWWVPSKSSNASGSTGGGAPGAVDTSKMSFAEFEAYRREQNGDKKKLY